MLKLITVSDASNLFKVSEGTIRNKISDKKIESKSILVKSTVAPQTPMAGSKFKSREITLYSFNELSAVFT